MQPDLLPARLRAVLSPADLPEVRMLTPGEITTCDARAAAVEWGDSPTGYSGCGCLTEAFFTKDLRRWNPEDQSLPLPELGAWLAACGIADDDRAQIVYSDEVGVELPWRLVARHMQKAFLRSSYDQLIVAADGSWMLGICHHDILSFGRVRRGAPD